MVYHNGQRRDEEIARLLRDKQDYFLPRYRRVVNSYPLGIEAARVKEIVQDEIIDEFDFDPFDPLVTGKNPSTDRAAGSQWANNLVSNRVLDEEMLVVRDGSRAVLYPLFADNSIPIDSPVKVQYDQHGVDDLLCSTADERRPIRAADRQSLVYSRVPALAAWVRQEADCECLALSSDCVAFPAKDGQTYVEVHHLIPMANQHQTQFNLDRTANMVALCPACHLKLHRSQVSVARTTLERALAGYRTLRGVDLQQAMVDCDLPSDIDSLLGYYGHF